MECGSGTKNYEGKTLKLKSAFLFMPLDVEGVRGWRSCFCLIAIFFLAHQKCFLPWLRPELGPEMREKGAHGGIEPMTSWSRGSQAHHYAAAITLTAEINA